MTQPQSVRLVTEETGNATYGTRAQSSRTRVETGTRADLMPHTLMWTPDEAMSGFNCVIAPDREHYVLGDRGIKMSIGGAATASVVMDPMRPVSPHGHSPAQAVVAQVWIEDASKVNWVDVTKKTLNADGTTSEWRRTNSQGGYTLKSGWNTLRWEASSSDMGDWNNTTYVRFRAITYAATTVTIGQIYLECPRKAKLILTNDGGHRSFADFIAAPFHARGWPITWAIGCSSVEAATLASPTVTVAELQHWQDTYGDAVTFHNSRGSSTEDMALATPEQARLWTYQAQKWLQSRGFTSWPFRGAWFRNNSPNAYAADSILAAGPTWNGTNTETVWPLRSRHNYPRRPVHGFLPATIDAQFAQLKKTRGLVNYYTHEYHVDAAAAQVTVDISPERWNYLLAKIDQAVAEGWLEVVTMEQLFHRAGARWVSGLDGARFEFTDETGTKVELGGAKPKSSALPPAEFTPKRFGTLKAWYDPTQLSLADGAAVTSWTDQSIHGNSLTAKAGTPTFDADGLNGTAGVRFPGGSSLSVPALNSPTGTGPLTVAFTAQFSSVAATANVFRGPDTSIWYSSSVNLWRYQRAGSVMSTATAPNTAPHIILVVFDGANSRFEIDGQVVHTGTTANPSESSWSVGGMVDGTNGMVGALGDVVVVQGTLSADERTDLLGWMATRSGITLTG